MVRSHVAAVVGSDHHDDELRRDVVHRSMLKTPEHVFRLVPAEAEIPGVSRGAKLVPGVPATQRVAVKLLAAEEVGDRVANEEKLRLCALHGGAGQFMAFRPVILRPASVLRDRHDGAGKCFMPGKRLQRGLDDLTCGPAILGEDGGFQDSTSGQVDRREVGVRLGDGVCSVQRVKDRARCAGTQGYNAGCRCLDGRRSQGDRCLCM